MVCKHRDDENCKFSKKPCFGAVFNREEQRYDVNEWQEKRCPTYESDGPEEVISSKSEWNLKEGEEYEAVFRIFRENDPVVCEDGECPPSKFERSVEEDAEILESLLNRRFEDRIKVEGIDTSSTRMKEFPEIEELIAKGTETPIGTLDDELKFISDIPLDILKTELINRGFKHKF
jgi:hypothetical protein